jgi:hypothetical protein
MREKERRVVAGEPGQQITDPLTVRLPGRPQLEILGSVVEPISIAVMHMLTRPECSTKQLLHHDAMLEATNVRRDRDLLKPRRLMLPVPG